MFARWPLCFALLFAQFPGASWAQSIEESNGEVLRSSAKPAKGKSPPDLARSVEIVIEQTNAFRKEEGREPVTVNAKLQETAEYFAQFMARTDEYGHQADGARPAERAKQHGYEYCMVSENIAYQFDSRGFKTEALADKFVQGWKESPSHRKNMLDPDLTETGVAIAQSAETGHYYAVQMFGRPRDLMIEFEIGNQTETPVDYKFADRSFQIHPGYFRTHRACRVGEVSIQLPGRDEPEVVQPESGDAFSVTADKEGEFRVVRAKASRKR